MTGRAKALAAAALLAAASPAFAQDGPGVPPAAVTMPGAPRAPRAALDEPAGAPRYAAEPPRGTPAEQAATEPPGPIADFAEALQRTYWTHPALLAERARLRGADYRLLQARAASGPKLGFEATHGYLRDNFEQAAGGFVVRSGWTTTASAILTQPLFTFGRNAAGERQALAEIAFQRAALRSRENDTLLNAIAAYAGVLRDRAAVGIFRDDLALLEREYSDNRARFTKREVTATDVLQVETRLQQSRAQLYQALRSQATSEAVFLAAVGAPPGALAPPNPLAMPAANLEEAYAHADAHSPVLGAAYARERISRAQRDAARSDMLPRFDLRGRADYGTVSPYSDTLRQTALRGEVVVSGPLFESGLRRARANEADAANDADWRLIDAALRENRVEVAEAWNEWLAQAASIERYRLASAAAREAFEGALLQEKAGFRTTLDVLNLARELLSARTSYNAATANAFIAQARLLAAIGALEQKRLFPDAPAYDPEEHFDRTKNDGQLPLIAPLLRRVDGLFVTGRSDRPIRDPAAPLAAPAAPLPMPGAETAAEDAN